MKQLGPLDASFLFLEQPHAPMHIGGLFLFDGNTPDGAMTYERFRDHLLSRLHVSPIFRRRLVEVPMNLDLPYWIEDPDFNPDLHLPHVGLGKPKDMAALMEMAGQVFSRPLDRRRPLWEITFVDGLEHVFDIPREAFALIMKVHHAAIDGISGEEILTALMDITPEPREIPETEAWEPEDIPGPLELMQKSFGPTIRSPFKVARLVRKSAGKTVRSVFKRIATPFGNPPLPFSSPPAPFNNPITATRVFTGVQMPLTDIKKVKNAIEGLTVNDVVLAICSGAIRQYLIEKDSLPDESLVTFAPVSVRTSEEKGQMGNKVSAMLVSLATDIPNALKRLEWIHRSARTSKQFNRAVAAEELLAHIPYGTAALAARLYTHHHLYEKHKPLFNLTTTNVPGPQFPVYMGGARLISQLGMAPIFDGLGLMLVIMSYNGSLGIGITSCPDIMPDTDRLAELLKEALAELVRAVENLEGQELSFGRRELSKVKGERSKSKVKAQSRQGAAGEGSATVAG